jgi:hypothetical protein
MNLIERVVSCPIKPSFVLIATVSSPSPKVSKNFSSPKASPLRRVVRSAVAVEKPRKWPAAVADTAETAVVVADHVAGKIMTFKALCSPGFPGEQPITSSQCTTDTVASTQHSSSDGDSILYVKPNQ